MKLEPSTCEVKDYLPSTQNATMRRLEELTRGP
jgi:hypothetical protein